MDGPRTRIGTVFGPYQLRSLLGRGGMGEVYEAYDTVKDRVVAVKLLPTDLAKDPVFQQRFRRESQAAARLAEPHVIPIHDWGEIDGVLYIDMRLVRGHDLRSVLRGEGPLSPARAIGILEQIASALDAAHAEGLVHRDVKPANILVTASEFAYLADFGIARSAQDPDMTGTGAAAIGSYSYIAPERFENGPVTGTADVYSLACVLYECLTGTQPFQADAMSVLIRSHLSAPPPRPSLVRAGVPAALDEVVVRGMAKKPTDRYSTAGGLASAAKSALTGRAVVAISQLPTDRMNLVSPKAPPTVVFPAVSPDEPNPSALPTDAIARPPGGRAPVDTGPRRTDPGRNFIGPPRAQRNDPPSHTDPPSRTGPSRESQRTDSGRGEPRQGTGIQRAPGGGSSRVYRADIEPNIEQRQDDSTKEPENPATPERRSRSGKPRLIAAFVIVALALVGVGGWLLRDQFRPDPLTPTLAPVPANAKGCATKYPPMGRFTYSAIGTSATTCEFAEEVRKAYGTGPDTDGTRPVAAFSPATQQDYTMECVTRDGLVTCIGGANAIVYIY
ncbi:serine/threonine-protein kinase [Nocardia brasiliensis]|uniref:serine/threonine-protein kinase n=1 Tax=Nocardia brasiliensis TaxID=37326 RepID=UPI002B4AAF15|nr:protein kinase [Nocardia brasiliensis]